jgi:hypothetical protein
LGIRYSLLPRFFGLKISLWRLSFGSLRIIFLLILSLWPIWFKVYETAITTESSLPKATWTQAIVGSVILSVLLGYNFFYDRITTFFAGKNKKRMLLQQLTNEIRGTISGFSPLIRVVKPTENREHINIARRRVLEWIRRVAQIHVSDYEGTSVEVTLLVFADEPCATMRIEDRTTHTRPRGKCFLAEEMMAYYVAKSRKHKCVNDFKNDPHPFTKAGLSMPDPEYRSILLIPLLDMEGGGPDNCVGVVSIDSAQPYHFWPGGGNELVQKVSPFCSWLAVLLNLTESYRLPCSP